MVVDELDVVLVVELHRVDAGGVGILLAAEDGFGQRGPLIGLARFLADEHDAAIEADVACGFGRLGAGEAGADDRQCGCGAHGWLLLFEARRSRGVTAARR